VQREAISAFTRVFDALWRNGALQTRDRYGAQTSLRSLRKLDCVWRSLISGAPLRAAHSRCIASGTRAR